MKIRISTMVVFGIVAFAFLTSLCFYSRLPEEMASHWNAAGEVDGYSPKSVMAFVMPGTIAISALMFIIIPNIGKMKANFEKFRKGYDGFIILFSIFLLAIHCQVILWNLGTEIQPNAIVPVGMGLLFFYLGGLCEVIKRNRLVGIKTPWTLSSDIVWEKTHKIGGKLFKAAGAITVLGVFFQDWAIYFVLIPVLSVAVFTMGYSYVAYRQEGK